MEKETLSAAYRRAGIEFLALKLMAVFKPLNTPEDIAAHNIIIHDVVSMLGDEKTRWAGYQIMGGAIIERALVKRSRRDVCKIVAESILGISKG